jgi:hypothetical protein
MRDVVEIAIRSGLPEHQDLTHDIKHNASRYKTPRGEKPNRYSGLMLRTRDIANRVNHRQHDQSECKRHFHMRYAAVAGIAGWIFE